MKQSSGQRELVSPLNTKVLLRQCDLTTSPRENSTNTYMFPTQERTKQGLFVYLCQSAGFRLV